jgi:hypothetical protein
MTCRDCIYYTKCMESLRMYVCTSFKKKEGEGNDAKKISKELRLQPQR